MSLFSFDVNSVPEREQGEYGPVPAGWYAASIQKVELRDTKSGGQMMNIRYDIKGPTNAGRVIFGNINVDNPNPKAVEIGREQLAQLMRSIGVDRINDTDMLIGHDLEIKVDVRANPGYPEQNNVIGWRPVNRNSGPSFADLETDFAPKQAASKSAPPWAAK